MDTTKKGVDKIKRIYERIRQVTANAQVSCLHILRGNNSKDANLTNQGGKLKIGSTNVKGNLSNIFYVP